MDAINIEIATPEAQVFEGSAVSVTVPGSNGRFQILKNHAPIISTLGKGSIDIATSDKGELNFRVEGGVVEVMENKVILLVEKVFSDSKGEDEN